MQEKIASHSPDVAVSDADIVAAPQPLVALIHLGSWSAASNSWTHQLSLRQMGCSGLRKLSNPKEKWRCGLWCLRWKNISPNVPFYVLNHSWAVTYEFTVWSGVWQCADWIVVSQLPGNKNHLHITQDAHLFLCSLWRYMDKDPSKMKISKTIKLIRPELPKLGSWSPG